MVKELNSNALYTLSKDLYEKDVVVYGTSYGAVQIFKELTLNKINVIAFADSYQGELETCAERTFFGKKIITLNELKEISNDVNIVLGTKSEKFMRQIIEKLNDLNINNIYGKYGVYAAGNYEANRMKTMIDNNKEKIDYVYQSLADEESKRVFLNLLYYRMTNDTRFLELSFETKHKQYFPNACDDIFTYSNEEVFVDAGAYDGNTMMDFIKCMNHQYKHIYSFEPDSFMFSILKETIKVKKIKDVSIYHYGVFDKRAKLYFSEFPDTGSSMINSNEKMNQTTIDTISLDELLYKDGNKITFIKMDIEGAEREALDGSLNIIRRDCPKLAISIYHKEDDLWEIPYKILTEYANYKLYIRHYTDITTETICYAAPLEKSII